MRATRSWLLLLAVLWTPASLADDGPRTLQMRDMAFPVRVFNTPWGLLDVVTRYPELLAATAAADIARVAARCRKTAVVSLLGDEKTVAEALKAAGR
jgi:hypothetical protein